MRESTLPIKSEIIASQILTFNSFEASLFAEGTDLSISSGKNFTNNSVGFGTSGTCSTANTFFINDMDIIPSADNSKSIGSSSYRWANLYVGDVQMSNEGTGGNEVDGTEGSWTIQEGEDDLFVINRKTGKKFKIKLEAI